MLKGCTQNCTHNPVVWLHPYPSISECTQTHQQDLLFTIDLGIETYAKDIERCLSSCSWGAPWTRINVQTSKMPWWLCQPQPEAEAMVLSLVPIPTIRQDKRVCFTSPSPFILLESNGSSTMTQNPETPKCPSPLSGLTGCCPEYIQGIYSWFPLGYKCEDVQVPYAKWNRICP